MLRGKAAGDSIPCRESVGLLSRLAAAVHHQLLPLPIPFHTGTHRLQHLNNGLVPLAAAAVDVLDGDAAVRQEGSHQRKGHRLPVRRNGAVKGRNLAGASHHNPLVVIAHLHRNSQGFKPHSGHVQIGHLLGIRQMDFQLSVNAGGCHHQAADVLGEASVGNNPSGLDGALHQQRGCIGFRAGNVGGGPQLLQCLCQMTHRTCPDGLVPSKDAPARKGGGNGSQEIQHGARVAHIHHIGRQMHIPPRTMNCPKTVVPAHLHLGTNLGNAPGGAETVGTGEGIADTGGSFSQGRQKTGPDSMTFRPGHRNRAGQEALSCYAVHSFSLFRK